MLLARPDGDKEPRIARQRGADRVRGEGLQVQRSAHVVIAGGAAALAVGEWLHAGASLWAYVALAAGVAALALAVARPPRFATPIVAGAALVGAAAAGLGGVIAARRIDCCWPAIREERVTRASRQLDATLTRA